MSFIPWWTLYPYVNDEAINLDWLLSKVTRDGEKLDDFITINSIKYADPILWDITSQYEANTITVDPQTGDAYISTKPVPYGTSLSNTDYWTKIYNYADAVNILMEQIAIANERLSTTATATRSIGDLVWLNGQLYEVIASMIPGDSYVEDSNCIKTTIEEYIKTRNTAINQNIDINRAAIGTLSNLTTTDKSNIVAAINEVDSNCDDNTSSIGTLANLTTTDKSNVVAAINEVDSNCDANTSSIGTLTSSIGTLSNLTTTDKSNVVAAINEVDSNCDANTSSIGTLANLTTTDKSNVVAAINEVMSRTASETHKIITIADSYGYIPSVAESWQSLLPNYITNATFTNLYEGSIGIYHVGNNGHNAQTLLSSTTISDPSSITDIIIGVGVNDYQDNVSDVSDAYDSLISYIKTNFVNAKIYFAFTGNKTNASVSLRTNLINLCKLMQNKASQYKCAFMDGVQYVMHNLLNVSSDNVHPLLAGSTALAIAISSCFYNGTYRYIFRDSTTANLTGGSSQTITYTIDNDTCNITLSDVASSNTFTFNANQWLEIGAITNPILDTMGLVPVVAQIYSTQESYPETISVLISNNKIYGKIAKGATIAVLQINAISFDLPTLLA